MGGANRGRPLTFPTEVDHGALVQGKLRFHDGREETFYGADAVNNRFGIIVVSTYNRRTRGLNKVRALVATEVKYAQVSESGVLTSIVAGGASLTESDAG